MNTHDIELPPLPRPRHTDSGYWKQDMHAYARAAIEPYQRRIEELESQLEAIGAGGVTLGKRLMGGRRSEPVGYFYSWELEHSLEIYPNGFPGAVAVYIAPQSADTNLDYKELFEQMCERCDVLDAKLVENERRGKPVAFFYELATSFDAHQMYSGWSPKLSFSMPNVPDGSIRNLKWLYAAPHSAEPTVKESLTTASPTKESMADILANLARNYLEKDYD